MIIVDINGNKRDCLRVSPDNNWPGYMKVEYRSQHRKDHQYAEWYPVEDFVKNNPGYKNLAAGAPQPAPETLGVVSKAGKLSLTDKPKNWKKNIFVNSPVWISRGKGEGQVRRVISNTKNTITIDRNWKTIPDKTSQYVISFNIHDPQILGNTLPGFEEINLKQKK